jgi:hypothetical protein
LARILGRNSSFSFSLPYRMSVLPMMPTPLPIWGEPRRARASLRRLLLGPRDAQPAAVADLLHERPAGRRVADLGHVLPGHVHDLGVVVVVEEALDLRQELLLFDGELEVHGARPSKI